MIKAEHLTTINLPYTTLCIFREAAGGVFAVEESALEQDVTIVSPYDNGTVLCSDMSNASDVLPNSVAEHPHMGFINTSENPYIPVDFVEEWLSGAPLMAEHGHPFITKHEWRYAVANGQTEASYAQWLTEQLNERYATDSEKPCLGIDYFWHCEFRHEMRVLPAAIQEAIKYELIHRHIPLDGWDTNVSAVIDGYTFEGYCHHETPKAATNALADFKTYTFTGSIEIPVTIDIKAADHASALKQARDTNACYASATAPKEIAWRYAPHANQHVRNFDEDIKLAS